MLKYFIALALLACVHAAGKKAVVTLGNGVASGNIYFTETDDGIHITGSVSGLTAGKHGFHIHAVGDLSGGCLTMLGHFNPHNVSHAAPDASERHVGDLGNIVAEANGVATIDFTDKIITLDGEHNIIGRGVVVHADEDDLGLGTADDSKTTGHAGSRIGCGVIGTLTESSADRLVTSILPTIIIGLVILLNLF